jgi:uncharacterized membrane-anchored protein YhcB (DUF1043 family)
MSWGFTSETSYGSSVSNDSNTCWVTVAIIVGVIIFILIINDLSMKKHDKYKKSQKNVSFYEEEEDEEEEKVEMKRGQCPYKN